MKKLLLLCLLAFSGLSQAQSAEKTLPGLAALSKAIVQQHCELNELGVVRYCELGEQDIIGLNQAVLDLLERAADRFEDLGITQDMFAFRSEVDKQRSIVNRGGSIGNIAGLAVPQTEEDTGINFDDDVRVEDPANCNAAVRQASNSQIETCKQVIDAFIAIYRQAQKLVEYNDAASVEGYLTINKAAWNKYYEQSRYQTLLERIINGRRWAKDKKPGEFLMPPDKQIIFLRPSPVIENVSDAVDGENVEESLMIEVAGMNWWRRDKWNQLSGASVVALYSDRASADDWGYGMAFHFGNKMTIGAVDRGGDTGVFVTIDVLEVIKNKDKLIWSYLNNISY